MSLNKSNQARLWLLLLVGLLSTGIVRAQLQEQRRNFSIGLNAGANFSKMDFTPSIPLGTLSSPSMGLTARYITERYFKMICGIQAELNYSQRGWKEDITDGSGDTYSRTLTYVEIPLLAHLAFGKSQGKGARFIVNLGPQIGFLIGDKEKRSATWNTSNRTNGIVEQYGKDAERKFDYGLVGGMGVELRTGVGNFIVEGRYYYGLSDIFNNSAANYFSRSANQYMGVRLTYLFDITH